MPLPRPILDDRSYQQLRDDLVRRIPVYAPEWTDHNPSDPGITLIELFAYLGENLLYRFNQIPETAHLEFLQLLQIPLRPARPARAMAALATDALGFTLVPRGSVAKAGSLVFETGTEVRALPVTCLAVCKAAAECPQEDDEPEVYAYYQRALDALDGLGAAADPVCYENRTVPPEGDGLPVDFAAAVDGMLWIAVLNATDRDNADLRKAITDHEDAPLLLNIGVVPDRMVASAAEVEPCDGTAAGSGPAVEWQIGTGTLTASGEPVYRRLRVEGDTSRGLTREGVVRLGLPRSAEDIGVFALDDPDRAGAGDLPPSLDDETAAQVLFWLRAFRVDGSRFGRLRWVGVNAAEVEQAAKARPEYLGTGTGQPDQSYGLIHKPLIAGSLVLEVEGPDGWQEWQAVDGFHASTESDRHYVLDAEAGTVRFGSGLQGWPPQIGQRIRARTYRYGGGAAGNVAAGAIAKLPAFAGLDIANPLPAHGGADAEGVAEALRRIPGELRRRDRAVTRDDFRELALMTPGADVGRAECLPRFHPHSRSEEAAGVVTLVVWPRQDPAHPDAPMPDRTLLRAVCEWLDARRLVTTELYVVPPVYRKVAVAVGLVAKPGYGIEAVRAWVELVIRQYLAPLPPYGPSGEGWPLGRRVHGPELEAAALQVEGVEYLEGLEVAGWDAEAGAWVSGTVMLDLDEVPELAEITVVEGPPLAAAGTPLEPPPTGRTPVPVPVIREEC